jgi:Mg-chelatase subunit ChlI
MESLPRQGEFDAMTTRSDFTLPFSAVVGQEELKLGLILNTVNPRIGGLLIRGPKGTGKSTAVYALAGLLPEREIADCAFGCDPGNEDFLCADCRSKLERGETIRTTKRRMRVIPLPLSVSEDRLVGSIDMEKMLSRGEKAFQPGLLAQANHNILYVDEINLLPDHITDDILDAASLGWNTVEREGFSVTHPAHFVLVGSMNPEEGELRPQLLDRLPLSVHLKTLKDVDQRVEVVRNNLGFARDPEGFRSRYAEMDREVARNILRARDALPSTGIDELLLRAAAEMCVELKADGQRPEIIITRTAMTLAAYRGHRDVDQDDLFDACRFTLSHRTREGGFEPPATEEEIRAALDRALSRIRKTKGPGKRFTLPAGPRDDMGRTGSFEATRRQKGDDESKKK